MKSHSIPPRVFNIEVYVMAPGRLSTSFAHNPWRKPTAPGPVISILAKLDSSNSAAASRQARCSVTMAVDQCWPAQPRGRCDSCSRSALDQYQLTRSQPLFSPSSAPKPTWRV